MRLIALLLVLLLMSAPVLAAECTKVLRPVASTVVQTRAPSAQAVTENVAGMTNDEFLQYLRENPPSSDTPLYQLLTARPEYRQMILEGKLDDVIKGRIDGQPARDADIYDRYSDMVSALENENIPGVSLLAADSVWLRFTVNGGHMIGPHEENPITNKGYVTLRDPTSVTTQQLNNALERLQQSGIQVSIKITRNALKALPYYDNIVIYASSQEDIDSALKIMQDSLGNQAAATHTGRDMFLNGRSTSHNMVLANEISLIANNDQQGLARLESQIAEAENKKAEYEQAALAEIEIPVSTIRLIGQAGPDGATVPITPELGNAMMFVEPNLEQEKLLDSIDTNRVADLMEQGVVINREKSRAKYPTEEVTDTIDVILAEARDRGISAEASLMDLAAADIATAMEATGSQQLYQTRNRLKAAAAALTFTDPILTGKLLSEIDHMIFNTAKQNFGLTDKIAIYETGSPTKSLESDTDVLILRLQTLTTADVDVMSNMFDYLAEAGLRAEVTTHFSTELGNTITEQGLREFVEKFLSDPSKIEASPLHKLMFLRATDPFDPPLDNIRSLAMGAPNIVDLMKADFAREYRIGRVGAIEQVQQIADFMRSSQIAGQFDVKKTFGGLRTIDYIRWQLAAQLNGDLSTVEDMERLYTKAIERGLLTPNEAQALLESERFFRIQRNSNHLRTATESDGINKEQLKDGFARLFPPVEIEASGLDAKVIDIISRKQRSDQAWDIASEHRLNTGAIALRLWADVPGDAVAELKIAPESAVEPAPAVQVPSKVIQTGKLAVTAVIPGGIAYGMISQYSKIVREAQAADPSVRPWQVGKIASLWWNSYWHGISVKQQLTKPEAGARLVENRPLGAAGDSPLIAIGISVAERAPTILEESMHVLGGKAGMPEAVGRMLETSLGNPNPLFERAKVQFLKDHPEYAGFSDSRIAEEIITKYGVAMTLKARATNKRIENEERIRRAENPVTAADERIIPYSGEYLARLNAQAMAAEVDLKYRDVVADALGLTADFSTSEIIDAYRDLLGVREADSIILKPRAVSEQTLMDVIQNGGMASLVAGTGHTYLSRYYTAPDVPTLENLAAQDLRLLSSPVAKSTDSEIIKNRPKVLKMVNEIKDLISASTPSDAQTIKSIENDAELNLIASGITKLEIDAAIMYAVESGILSLSNAQTYFGFSTTQDVAEQIAGSKLSLQEKTDLWADVPPAIDHVVAKAVNTGKTSDILKVANSIGKNNPADIADFAQALQVSKGIAGLRNTYGKDFDDFINANANVFVIKDVNIEGKLFDVMVLRNPPQYPNNLEQHFIGAHIKGQSTKTSNPTIFAGYSAASTATPITPEMRADVLWRLARTLQTGRPVETKTPSGTIYEANAKVLGDNTYLRLVNQRGGNLLDTVQFYPK